MILDLLIILMSLLTLSSIWIIIRGPGSLDRLQGLAVFSSKITMLIVLFSLRFEQSYLSDIAIVASLLGFIGIVMISRYIRQGGAL
ncbi:MAG: monovalent cation/H+ antiporter complex subunit F [Eubacteriales bacterium]|nr:monovalent cation/H+ antiporter complex subunit F [Eubacteriales bacterium]